MGGAGDPNAGGAGVGGVEGGGGGVGFGLGVGVGAGVGAVNGEAEAPAAGGGACSLNTSRFFRASNSVGVRAPASSISFSWRRVSRGEDGFSIA